LIESSLNRMRTGGPGYEAKWVKGRDGHPQRIEEFNPNIPPEAPDQIQRMNAIRLLEELAYPASKTTSGPQHRIRNILNSRQGK
jgi:hypothetical protein